MAMSAGTVSLAVKATTDNFGSQLKKDISREVKGSGLEDIGKFVGGTIAAGIGAVMAGVGAVVATGITETLDASKGIAQLEAGIKSTGNAAGVSVKGMTDLAGSIQNMSGQTDDSIVKAEQLLLTFTNIKNQGPHKIFDQATQAAADMAAKMGGDASGNAILLGKALNDPIKGISALTRVGVTFSEGQKASIKAMMEHGDTAGAQSVILKELNTEFGGAAAAAGQSLPGQLNIAKRSFEDLSQSVVGAFLPVVIPLIKSIAPAIQQASPVIQEVAGKVIGVLKQAWDNLAPALNTVWNILKALGGFIVNVILPAIGNFTSFIKDNWTWIGLLFSVIAGAVVGFKIYEATMGIIKIATVAWTVVQNILNGTLALNPIMLVVIAVMALIAAIIWIATQTTWFQDIWKAAMAGITVAFKAVGDFIAGVFNWIGQNWPLLLAIITGPIGLAVLWIITHWGQITEFFKAFIGVLGGIFSGIGQFIGGIFKNAINFVIDALNGFLGFINTFIDGIDLALAGVKAISGGAIDLHINHIPKIPHLAKGGVVMPKPGGQIVKVAEAGEAEAVIPLSKLNGMGGGGHTVNYYAAPNASIDAQADLFTAMRRAKLLAGW